MKMHHNIFLILSLALTFAACEQEAVSSSEACNYVSNANYALHPKANQLEAMLTKYQKQGLPGLVLMIEDADGQWVGYAGKADIQKDLPFLPCYTSKVGSITKPMIAALAFKLQEEGTWDLDDPLSKYIDANVLDRITNSEGVTIRNCLQHTTGFYDVITDAAFYLAVINNPNKTWSPMDLVPYVYDKPSAFEPGEVVRYSNTNTLMVVMAMEAALGYDHGLALRNKILNPVGLMDTYYQGREALPGNVAQGYFDLYNDGSIVNLSNLITGSGNGFTGIYSTVYDLNRFAKALLVERTLLKPESMVEMLDFIYVDEREFAGVGIYNQFQHVTSEPVLGHAGGDLAYSAGMYVLPTRNNAVVTFLVNYGTNGDTPLREVYRSFEREIIGLMAQP